MDVTYDFSDIASFINEAENEIEDKLERVGEEAVAYAKEHGSYQNRTGNLRRSNKYKVDEEGLTLYNDADYAADVEKRGYEVLSGAVLFAEKRLKEEFGI
jgi:hypothetical protein